MLISSLHKWTQTDLVSFHSQSKPNRPNFFIIVKRFIYPAVASQMAITAFVAQTIRLQIILTHSSNVK